MILHNTHSHTHTHARTHTQSMLLAIRQRHQLHQLHLNFSLKNSHIEQIHAHRHLGVIIDDEFSWRPHIIGACKTV